MFDGASNVNRAARTVLAAPWGSRSPSEIFSFVEGSVVHTSSPQGAAINVEGFRSRSLAAKFNMGKTLDALLGRRSSKLSTLLEHAINRTALLKNRQQALFSFSRSDIVQLLQLSYEEQALLRVLILNPAPTGECPNELKEATSSLIFASSRIGDFPELQHIREYFSSKFGKEYSSQVIEFPRYLGVNDKMIEKLSRRKPSVESRIDFLKEIAMDNGLTLHLNENTQQR
ncbi:hypothetical protein Cgig2_011937 [Carnegiea gigantea]|uniref:Uncharacterized protein n=1 Tax=Carnegiea gigantea TaxID=171969 RepID=A0A9Q1GUU8_9CARY|nr:hypothetical protein Cgig2_011937 [Carnegiea gigantea]